MLLVWGAWERVGVDVAVVVVGEASEEWGECGYGGGGVDVVVVVVMG